MKCRLQTTALALLPFASLSSAAPPPSPIEYTLFDRAAVTAWHETVSSHGDTPIAAYVRSILDWVQVSDARPSNVSSFIIRDSWIRPGSSALLSWNSPGSDRCSALFGWAGELPPRGTAMVGPVYDDTAFALNCSGSLNGVPHTDFMMTAITMRRARLSWHGLDGEGVPVAPDSSGGFLVRYGVQPVELKASIRLPDAALREWTLILEPGTYYFRVASLDAMGNETGYSNVAAKQIE